MKNFLFLGLTALGLALASEQSAQAWINSKFSVGLNWHWQSGGNNLFWGLFRNGQYQGPDSGPFQIQPPPPGAPTFPGYQPHYGANEFQYFGKQSAPGNGYPATPNVTPAPPAAAAAQQQQAYGTPAWAGQQTPYQPVSYTPNPYGYPSTDHYAPGYYGYHLPPSYWYGR